MALPTYIRAYSLFLYNVYFCRFRASEKRVDHNAVRAQHPLELDVWNSVVGGCTRPRTAGARSTGMIERIFHESENAL